MQRGEVWWVEFDERRPVVLLSGDEGSGFQAVQIVAAADVSIEELGVEVAVGAADGLPIEGVLRFAFPRPGFTPCTWVTTLSCGDLIEQAGALPAAKVDEIEDAIRLCEQPRAWTPATAAQFNEIRNALPRSGRRMMRGRGGLGPPEQPARPRSIAPGSDCRRLFPYLRRRAFLAGQRAAAGTPSSPSPRAKGRRNRSACALRARGAPAAHADARGLKTRTQTDMFTALGPAWPCGFPAAKSGQDPRERPGARAAASTHRAPTSRAPCPPDSGPPLPSLSFSPPSPPPPSYLFPPPWWSPGRTGRRARRVADGGVRRGQMAGEISW